MKIYLASAYSNKDLVSDFIHRLPPGLTVTHDWTVYPSWLREEDKGKREDALTPGVRLRLAEEDMRGVLSADILWLLTPTKEEGGCGCFIEFGMALAMRHDRWSVNKRRMDTIVSGAQRSIFQDLATYTLFASHEEAFRFLVDCKLPTDPDDRVL